jgi:group I intron endonuclease
MAVLCGIYRIRNKANDHAYIGSTSNFSKRKSKHLKDLRMGNHHSFILQRAFDKHGEAAFVFEFVEAVADTVLLLERELAWIQQQAPVYNICQVPGKTRLGQKSSETHRANQSAALMGRSGTNLGKKFSAEHKRKIGLGNKGKGPKPGYHHTSESIEKMKKLSVGKVPKRSQAIQEKARLGVKAFHANMSPEERIAWRAGRKKPERNRSTQRKVEHQ